jgi:CRISPR-associated endonuclease/helicase Cas3
MPIYAKSARNGEEEKERLAEHTIRDIEAGRVLVANLPFGAAKRKRIGKDLDLTIAFHDIGKAATGFQKSLERGAKYWGRRHEILSAVAASSLGLKEEVIFGIITHHKMLPSSSDHGCLTDEQIPYSPDHIYTVWLEMSEEWNKNIEPLNEEWSKIANFIGREDLSFSLKPLGSPTYLSDQMRTWLTREDQPKFISFKQRYYASLLRGLMISADHMMSAGATLPPKIPRLSDYDITSYNWRGFQIDASKKKGNLILRAPTGSGKTEAAIKWAQLNQRNNGRLFYTLPTTASLNAMFKRLKKSFHDGNDNGNDDNRLVGLLHSRVASSIYSMLEQDNDSSSRGGSRDVSISNQAIAKLSNSLAREMYYPIRVCTPHQILRYSLQGKGWELMLSEFPNSCFIFDEIHAYNPKLVGLIMATAKFLVEKKATCMFLTATLPKFLKELIEKEIPSIEFIQPSYHNDSDRRILEQKRHIIEIVDGNVLSNIDLIVRETEKANSTLVICNHVPTAQEVYERLRERVKDTVLLHTRFCRRDRNIIENDLLRSKLPQQDKFYKQLPKILVATQVIEVSLDLDFTQGFTEPAPIDALIQRLGRINRYANSSPAKVRIFTQQLHSYQIYEEELTQRSLQVLSSLPNPLTEENLNHAADRVYGNGYSGNDETEYQEGLNYIPLKNFKRELVAGTCHDWIEEAIDRREENIDMLIDQMVDEYYALKRQGLIIKANDLLVPVARRRLSQLFEENRIDRSHDPWVLSGCEYSSEVGLQI